VNYSKFGVKLKPNKMKKNMVIHCQLGRAVGKSTYVLVSNIFPYSLEWTKKGRRSHVPKGQVIPQWKWDGYIEIVHFLAVWWY